MLCHIVNCLFRDVNNDIMEMLIMGYAFKTSSARKIVGVVPYLPYSKQSKMRKRGCIVAKLIAQMMSMSGELRGTLFIFFNVFKINISTYMSIFIDCFLFLFLGETRLRFALLG